MINMRGERGDGYDVEFNRSPICFYGANKDENGAVLCRVYMWDTPDDSWQTQVREQIHTNRT